MTDSMAVTETDLPTFEERVDQRTVGPCRLLTLPTPVQSVVSWKGSIRVDPDFAAGDELVQEVAVAMLDKGTRKRDRFAVAEILEDRGAELRFASEGLRVEFSGRALREDIPEVLQILAEQLQEPLFDAEEFDKVKAQVAASLHRALENTRIQASSALARRLYGPAHPNYAFPTQETLSRLAALTVDDVRAYHEQHVGANELTLVLVGDVDADGAQREVEQAFAGWKPQAATPAFDASASPQEPGQSRRAMPDKMNVDVRIGHALHLRRQDDDFIPLHLANYVLGGNFSARLMTVIRDEMGLTYGIGSALSGITTEHDGHWQINVTLSQENLDRGIEATLAEVKRFIADGVTDDEVRDKKTTLTGSYKVGLASTGNLADALHVNEIRGFGAGYLDRFPAEIEAVTPEHANDAIRRHFDPDALHVALAGTVERG